MREKAKLKRTGHDRGDGVVDGGRCGDVVAAVAVLRAGGRGGDGGQRQVQVDAGQRVVVERQQRVHQLRPARPRARLQGDRQQSAGGALVGYTYLELPAVAHDLVEVVWTLERYRHPVAVLGSEKLI